jgi:hypothetical protein
MEGDRPWPLPAAHVVVERRWKYAAPPWVVYEAVVNEKDRWLSPRAGELQPQVAASRRPDSVLLKPWLDSSVSAVELLIGSDGPGTAITILAYGEVPTLPEEARRRVRHRLGTIFGAALRDWVDEGHW